MLVPFYFSLKIPLWLGLFTSIGQYYEDKPNNEKIYCTSLSRLAKNLLKTNYLFNNLSDEQRNDEIKLMKKSDKSHS